MRIAKVTAVLFALSAAFGAWASPNPSAAAQNWNDDDMEAICGELAEQCTQSEAIAAFTEEKGRPPIVFMDKVKNNSADRINAQKVKDYLQGLLEESGVVTFVENAGPSVEFMLLVTINCKDDLKASGNKKYKRYYADMELMNTTTYETAGSFASNERRKEIPIRKIRH